MFLAQHRPAGKLRALGRVSSPLRVIGGAVALSRRPGSPVRVVTPLRSEPASAPGEESTPVSASVLVATGCAWRGRAGGPAKPEARRDTKKAKERLFCEDRIVTYYLESRIRPRSDVARKTMMEAESSARFQGPFLHALCVSLPFVLTPFAVGPDIASLCTREH